MSEFRQDPISRDWVIIAPERAKRPDELVKKRDTRKPSPRDGCPFENLETSGNWPPFAMYPAGKRWKIAAIPNKYPALSPCAGRAPDVYRDIYRIKPGVGDHEIIIGRDHLKNFPALPKDDAIQLLMVLQERHRAMAENTCNAYVSSFCNWGPSAGASIWHPHYQMLTLPIVPPHIAHSLHGAEAYFKKNKRCVRCDMIVIERKAKKRVLAENRHAIAFAPYASKRPFEIAILPKVHEPFFEKTSANAIADIAGLLQLSLQKIRKKLKDPDFNFFIHSAPIDGKEHSYHHWHIEIVPVDAISPPGGFEIGNLVNINVIDPEVAVAMLLGKHTAR